MTTTPLQALALLNDQAFVELAQGLAIRVLKEGPASDAERLVYAFRLCLARRPSSLERDRLERLLRQQSEEYRQAPDESRALAPENLPPNTAAPQLAAWTAVARVLLNLDEFITRE